jgi:hypothetical protein
MKEADKLRACSIKVAGKLSESLRIMEERNGGGPVEVTPGVGQLPPDFFWETAAQKEKRINKKNKHLKSGLEGTGGERDDSKPHSLWCKKKENDGRVEDRLPEMKEMLLDCFGKGKKDRKIIVGEGLLPVAIHAENLDTGMIGQIREIILSVGRKKRAQMMLQGVVRLFHADPGLGASDLDGMISELKSVPKKARFEYLNMQIVPWVLKNNKGKDWRIIELSNLLKDIKRARLGSKRIAAELENRNGDLRANKASKEAPVIVKLVENAERGVGKNGDGKAKGFGDLLSGRTACGPCDPDLSILRRSHPLSHP